MGTINQVTIIFIVVITGNFAFAQMSDYEACENYVPQHDELATQYEKVQEQIDAHCDNDFGEPLTMGCNGIFQVQTELEHRLAAVQKKIQQHGCVEDTPA